MFSGNLELYVYEGCRFCDMVLNFMKDHNIECPVIDLESDPEAFQRLLKDTGGAQAPCLFIDNDPLLESADIINWLEKNLV